MISMLELTNLKGEKNKNRKRQLKGKSLIDSVNNYVVIDIETTGYDTKTDKIIELAALRIRDNRITDTFESLINPDIKIDKFISNLTGITNDMLKSAPHLYEKIKEFINFISNDIIIGHNVNFDINFIYDNSLEILDKPLSNDFIDTLRISRNYVLSENHKLKTLATLFDIDYTNAHRALKDCYITYQLYNILKEKVANSPKIVKNHKNDYDMTEVIKSLLENFVPPKNNTFYGKKLLIKYQIKNYDEDFMQNIARKCGAKVRQLFFEDTDIIVLGTKMYQKYRFDEQYDSEFKQKAKKLEKNGTLKVISEEEFLTLNDIPLMDRSKKKTSNRIKAKDILTNIEFVNIDNPLYNKEIVFTGTLEKMTRKEAMQIVVNLGGKNRDNVTRETNFLILGNNDYCKSIKNEKSLKHKKAETYKLEGQDIEVISENVFYDMIEDYINF